MVLPVAAFAVWQLSFGRGDTVSQDPLAISTVLQAPGFISRSIVFAVGSVLGVGEFGALCSLTAAAIVIAKRGASPLLLAAASGLFTEFLLISLIRSDTEYVETSRYLYAAAVFTLLGFAEITRTVERPTLRMLAGAVLVAALAGNTVCLAFGPSQWGAVRYRLPAAFGCIPVATISDPSGTTNVPWAMRCLDGARR